jgi:HTH-type transcriptional regulator / antitoxin HigA
VALTVRANARDEADGYRALMRRLPLRPLKDDTEHDQAVGIIKRLMGRDVDAGTSDYLDTLILLVNKYEDEYHTPGGAGMTGRQVMQALMEANNMTQAQMGEVIGSQSAVSNFLSGERALTKRQIKALVKRFRVDAALFL